MRSLSGSLVKFVTLVVLVGPHLGCFTLAAKQAQDVVQSEASISSQAAVNSGGQGAGGMDAFTKDGVVPDVVDEVPPAQLKVKYGSLEVTPGKVLKPTQVKDPPTVEWDADPNAFYTLIMNDPDAPSRQNPKFGQWHHWMVGNIPGSDLNQGEVLSAYVGAGPPANTGLHRYVLLLYKQDSKQAFEGRPRLTNTSADHRGKQNAKETAAEFHLGKPIAGNFFQAEYDDYVPKLYKQLGL